MEWARWMWCFGCVDTLMQCVHVMCESFTPDATAHTRTRLPATDTDARCRPCSARADAMVRVPARPRRSMSCVWGKDGEAELARASCRC